MMKFGKATEWLTCSRRGLPHLPEGKPREVGRDGRLYQHCTRCGAWVEVRA